MVIMDVPLLFETGGGGGYDAVVVVCAPHFVERSRALSRPGMSAGRFDSILQKQIPDRLKRRRADFIIFSGIGKRNALVSIRNILAALRLGLGQRKNLSRTGRRRARSRT